MATHSSILAWRIPWIEKPGGLWSIGLQSVGHSWTTNTFTFHPCSVKLKVLVAQSYPTLSDPMDCTLPGSSVHGILQQEHWSGLPFPSPRDLPDPGMEPRSPALQANSLLSEPPGKPFSALRSYQFRREELLKIELEYVE